jgi:hypothetical protein
MRIERQLDQLDSDIGQHLAEVAWFAIDATPEERARLDSFRVRLQQQRTRVAFLRDELQIIRFLEKHQ